MKAVREYGPKEAAESPSYLPPIHTKEHPRPKQDGGLATARHGEWHNNGKRDRDVTDESRLLFLHRKSGVSQSISKAHCRWNNFKARPEYSCLSHFCHCCPEQARRFVTQWAFYRWDGYIMHYPCGESFLCFPWLSSFAECLWVIPCCTLTGSIDCNNNNKHLYIYVYTSKYQVCITVFFFFFHPSMGRVSVDTIAKHIEKKQKI